MDAFYDIIDWLQSGYVLMENVLDILSKENGMYAKYATARGCCSSGTRRGWA